MNIERWIGSRMPSWQRLEGLLGQVERRGLRSLDRQQLHELGRLYRAVSADLSRARAFKVTFDLKIYLNNLVVKAHNQVYQRRRNRWADLWHFLWITFPQLVQEHILYVAVAFVVFWLPALACYAFVIVDENFAHLELSKGHPLVGEDMWNMLEKHKMWTDSVQDCSPIVSSEIATNNMRVALMSFALGAAFGLGTIWVLCINGMIIGTIFGACALHGMDFRLLSFIAPHGILELSAIFICGGGGLLLGWALVFPGQLTRGQALRKVAKPAMGLFAGCLPILAIAGSIEGFVSPRTDLHYTIKFAVGLATLCLLLAYLFVPRNQVNSSLGEEERNC